MLGVLDPLWRRPPSNRTADIASLTCMTCGTRLKVAVGSCPTCGCEDWGPTPPRGSSSDDLAGLLGCVAVTASERQELRANGGSAALERKLDHRLQVQDRLLGERVRDELTPERRARLVLARFKVQQQLAE